jgi:hypothetical protein
VLTRHSASRDDGNIRTLTVTNQPSGRKGKRAAAPTPTRLPSTRERRPALAALAVLLIAGGAVLAGWLALREGHTSSYLVVRSRVSVNEQITSGDLGVIELPTSSGGDFVVAGQRDSVVGTYALTDLIPGSPVVGGMYGKAPSLPPDASRIGLSLAAGRYPPSLSIGDNVTIVVLDPSGNNNAAQGTAVGVVRDVQSQGTGQGVVVDAVVSAQCNTVLTAAAANGDVALNLLAPGDSTLSCSAGLLGDAGSGAGG